MMHKKNFVCAIKVDGKVLRESNDRVELPFGSEYSVLLKNLDTVRMQAQISIDGQDATGWLVVGPGQSVDVERFFRQNLDRGNRFKFIERTERIEEHRGVKAEDGLVRVEFRREKVYEYPKIVEHHTYYHYTWPYYYTRPYPGSTNFCGTIIQQSQNSNSQGSFISQSGVFQSGVQANTRSATASSISGSSLSSMNMMRASEPINDVGITVDGSISNQKFVNVNGFECDQSEVIVLHLIGRKQQVSVKVAKTVDKKPMCDVCGKKNKAISKFCAECGTSLEEV
jgi:hypothetical protein